MPKKAHKNRVKSYTPGGGPATVVPIEKQLADKATSDATKLAIAEERITPLPVQNTAGYQNIVTPRQADYRAGLQKLTFQQQMEQKALESGLPGQADYYKNVQAGTFEELHPPGAPPPVAPPPVTPPPVAPPPVTPPPAPPEPEKPTPPTGVSLDDVAFDLSRKSNAEKWKELGIDEERQGVFNWMYKNKRKPDGTVNDNVQLGGISPEQLKEMQGLGIVSQAMRTSDGTYNVVLKVAMTDYTKQYEKYRNILEGGDVRAAMNAATQRKLELQGQSTAPVPTGQQPTLGQPNPYSASQQPTGGQTTVRGTGGLTAGVGQNSRVTAINRVFEQGISDPEQIQSFLNDRQGGDYSLGEIQRTLQAAHPPMLPGPNADPNQFIDSFDMGGKALMAQGMLRDQATGWLQQENADSIWMMGEGWEDAKERRERQLDFNSEITDIQRSREIVDHEKALAIQQLDQSRAEAIARDQAEEDEQVSRLAAARTGINMDTGGVKWMRDIVRKSNEHLSYIIQRGGIESSSMVREHTNNMNAIDLDARMQYDKVWDDYDSKVSSLKGQRRLDKKSIQEQQMKYEQAYVDKLWEVDKFKAERQNKELERADTRAWEMYKLDRQETIDGAKTRMQTAKDRRDFAHTITQDITSSVPYKKWDETRSRAASSRETFELYKQGAVDRSVMANALTKNFEKILDPTSVVREGEFQMTEALQPFFSLKKWIGLKQKLSEGGTGVSDQVFSDMVDLADAFTRVALKSVQEQAATALWQADDYNQYLDNPITLDMIMPRGLPVGDWDSYGQSAAGYYGNEEIQAPTFDYQNTENIPSTNAFIQTSVGSGIITGYGSAASKRGLDFAGRHGQSLRAPMGGTVVESTFNQSWQGNPFADDKDFSRNKRDKSDQYKAQVEQNGGYGNSVLVKLDNGMTVRMSHLSGVTAKKGQRIEYGAEIGKMGNTGITYGRTGNHVDIEMQGENGRWLTPQQVAAFIGAGGEPEQVAETESSVIPKAHAAEYPTSSGAGQVLGSTSQEMGDLGEMKVIGTFRIKSTGQVLHPSDPSRVEFYKTRPDLFEDLESPQAARPTVRSNYNVITSPTIINEKLSKLFPQ